MTQNQIDNNKDKKDDKKNTINDTDLQTTETDMMFDYFANEDKLVSEDKMKGFDKNDLSPIEEKEDNISDYCDSDKNDNENNEEADIRKLDDIFENYIKVSSFGNAEKTNKHDTELYCLITSDHRIPIGEYTFWDWED